MSNRPCQKFHPLHVKLGMLSVTVTRVQYGASCHQVTRTRRAPASHQVECSAETQLEIGFCYSMIWLSDKLFWPNFRAPQALGCSPAHPRPGTLTQVRRGLQPSFGHATFRILWSLAFGDKVQATGEDCNVFETSPRSLERRPGHRCGQSPVRYLLIQ